MLVERVECVDGSKMLGDSSSLSTVENRFLADMRKVLSLNLLPVATHNNLVHIHIHKWRMHIRDKFLRGTGTPENVNYFLGKLKAAARGSCVLEAASLPGKRATYRVLRESCRFQMIGCLI